MTGLAAFQRDFLAAVTARDAPAEPGLKVHHDTWLFGLIEALESLYPATRILLGGQAFKAFARDHVRAHPLAGGDRNRYGRDFAGFLTRHPHLDIGWLPALARYEFALHEAETAPDADGCQLDDLLDPGARVTLHPSVRLVHLDHNIKDAYAATLAGAPPPPVPAMACDGLVGRDRDDGLVHLCLAPLEARFVEAVARTASLGDALAEVEPTPDDMTFLQRLLARLVGHGLLIAQTETA